MAVRHTTRSDGHPQLWRGLAVAAAGILVLVPFHALFTTWLGSNFGHLDLFRTWKDWLLLAMAAAALAAAPKTVGRQLKRDRLWQLIGLYALLFVGTGVAAAARHSVTTSALTYSLIINLRFLLFFTVVWLAAAHDRWLHSRIGRIIAVPALIVILFGLLQHFILPADFLRHFGYGPATIPPYQAVDLKPDYIRVQSTLRGANPLGAYLVAVLTFLIVYVIAGVRALRKDSWPTIHERGRLLLLTGMFMGGLEILFYTYSRSAWLGFLVSLGVVLGLTFRATKYARPVGIAAVVAVLLIGGSVLINRHNDTVENTFFHTDEHSQSARSSNSVRAGYVEQALTDIQTHPFGTGPGTAGPASFRNDGKARIAENYFLQIGQETGIAGMSLFVAINAVVGWRLWRQRAHPLALIAFASLLGLTLVNMFSHAWADDTLAYLWWGLAAVALAKRAARGPAN
jgi:O-antigen ligase